MQFKVKVIIAIWMFLILGLIAYFLLRKKDVPEDEDDYEDEPIEDPLADALVDDVVADQPEQPTPTTNPAQPLIPTRPRPDPVTQPEQPVTRPEQPTDQPEQPTPTTNPAQPLIPTRPRPDPVTQPEQPVTQPEEPADQPQQPTPTTNPAQPLIPTRPRPDPVPNVPPMTKHFGHACVAPNVIKQWREPSRPQNPTPEMTAWCHNNLECSFIWSDDRREDFYACKSTGTFSYPRHNWKPTRTGSNVPPMTKHYGSACVAPNVIKQWRKPSRPQNPTPEMTAWCHNNPACSFIWSDDRREEFYACKSTGTFSYPRHNWRPAR